MSERLTQATVIQDNRSLFDYKAGEIGQPFPAASVWYIACPNCGGKTSLSDWQVIENADSTITVNPSILCYGCSAEPCGAHYFIVNNEIRWC